MLSHLTPRTVLDAEQGARRKLRIAPSEGLCARLLLWGHLAACTSSATEKGVKTHIVCVCVWGGTPGALEQSVSNRITKWCLYDFLLLDLVEQKDFLMMFIVQIDVGLFATPWTAARPGSPVHHYLLEFAQIHVHWIGDVIQPSHPLSPPFSSCLLHLIWAKRLRSDLSPLALNLSQNRGPFQWVVGSLHLVAKVLERLNVIYFFMTQFESFCISRKKAILMLNC